MDGSLIIKSGRPFGINLAAKRRRSRATPFTICEVGPDYGRDGFNQDRKSKRRLGNYRKTPSGIDSYSENDDFDGSWKRALEQYFYNCLELLAPNIYKEINTDYEPEFLDKELQSIFSKSKYGVRLADKLVKVRLKNKQSAILLIHIEVESRANTPKLMAVFSKRMFDYYVLILNRFSAADIYSLGILLDSKGAGGDEIDSLNVDGDIVSLSDITSFEVERLSYRKEVFGNAIDYKFQIIHLGKYINKIKQLELLANSNPFAIIVLAQLYAVRDKTKRLNPKIQLIRLLSNYGYSTQDKRELFNIVDWIIKLPNDLQPHFADWIKSEQESPAMRYINTVERFAIKEGIEVGREEGMQIGEAKGIEIGLLTGQSNLLISQLQHRFGDLPADITDKVKNATLEQIQTWSVNILDAKTIDEVFA